MKTMNIIVEPGSFYFNGNSYIGDKDPILMQWGYIGMEKQQTYRGLIFIITPLK